MGMQKVHIDIDKNLHNYLTALKIPGETYTHLLRRLLCIDGRHQSFLPFRFKSKFSQKELVEEAEGMLWELKEMKQLVVLVPAPVQMFPGHKIRVVEQDCTGWYAALYDAKFRRPHVEMALKRVVADIHKPYKVDEAVRQILEERLEHLNSDDEDHSELYDGEDLQRINMEFQERS